ncbi:dynein axonemal heavy chain 12-like [Schistocerca nitens]|uniref:dynein axonemal heavy chain 12-like n=1 Tax=Schistocerca nitens TaxID=7011 RepID=UPI0021181ED7|nr:dynein axonemal heavy chain 12-like [Schistocerca nitens]
MYKHLTRHGHISIIIELMYKHEIDYIENDDHLILLFYLVIDLFLHLGSMSIEERLKLLTDTFTISLYQQVSQSLFERDKLTFSFILCSRIMIAQDELSREEFMFLVMSIVDVESLEPNPAPEWLRNEAWSMLCQIEVLPAFSGFKEHFKKQISGWKQYSTDVDASLAKLPSPWAQRLSQFEALILIRIFHPDKVSGKDNFNDRTVNECTCVCTCTLIQTHTHTNNRITCQKAV